MSYLPDSLTLQAHGWLPCPTKNPAWVRDHPTNEAYGCRMWPDYETRMLKLVEHERRELGRPTAPGITVFRGTLRDSEDYRTVLRLVGWHVPD